MTAFTACDEIEEGDLTNKEVHVISPSDSIHSTDASINFYWDLMDEATGYRLQVVTPNFQNTQSLIVDTLCPDNQFTLAVPPGVYQWRIRPENNSSFGNFVTRTIFIDSTFDLSNQEIILQSPLNLAKLNSEAIDFTWFELYNASQYSWLIKNNDWSGSLIVPEIITTETNLSLANLPEGQFSWGVRGESNTSNTPYTYRTLIIDRTAPELPIIQSPMNNEGVISPVLFTWEQEYDQGTSIGDSLFISSNSNFSNIIWKGESFGDTLSRSLNSGTYFWRIKSFDEAGNESEFTESENFYVQ